LDDGGGGVVTGGGGVVTAGAGGVVAAGGVATGAPVPAGAVLVVRLANVAEVAVGADDAVGWLTVEPTPPPDPVVGAPPEGALAERPPDEVGLWGAEALGLLPLAPEPPVAAPAWGPAGSEGTFGAVEGSADEVVLDGVWLEPTVRPARTSKSAAAIPLMVATARSYGRRRRFGRAVLPTAAPKPVASAAEWPKSRDVKMSSRVL
jgi:hypothetical protein